MNSSFSPESHDGSLLRPGDDGFSHHLAGLRTRLASATATSGSDSHDVSEVLADLESAHEELRVADEEVRSQHDEISHLLVERGDLRRQHTRMVAALPIAAVVTDADGIIRSANAAAATLVGVGVARLLGKPIFVFFAAEVRREVRDLLTCSRHEPGRAHIELRPRLGDPVSVSITVAGPARPSVVHTWLLLPVGAASAAGLADVPNALTELTGLPATDLDVQAVLSRAAQICHRAVGGLDLSVTAGDPVEPERLASTSTLAQSVDGAQVAAGEGPCVTAFSERVTVTSADLATDPRWPTLQRLLPAASCSVIAVPIEVGTRLVGALTIYSPGAFAPWIRDAAELLGATLGAVFYELELSRELVELGEHMERALASRPSIEQAKGIIMGLRRCGPDEAFAHLRELSSQQGRKLRDVAEMIVHQMTGGN